MDFENVYRRMTDVDIQQQKQIWDERGKGYYGEYLVFCELYKKVKGNCKILMNLNVPVDETKTTEVDLVLVHESGIYVFEVKHYKGTIYGKDTDKTWTQYFRTVKNSAFRNPIEQNQYHVSAIKKLFPNVPIYSYVVFTNTECVLKVNNSRDDVSVVSLAAIGGAVSRKLETTASVYTMDTIEDMFNKLLCFSQMNEPVQIDGKEATFYSWIQPIITELEKERDELDKLKENCKKTKKYGLVFNVVIAVICVIIMIFTNFVNAAKYDAAIQANTSELNSFKQNFLHVDEIGNEYITAVNSYVKVSDVLLMPTNENTVSFTAKLTVVGDEYGVKLTKDSKYIVHTKLGKVFEYDVFGEYLKYNSAANMLGRGIRQYGDLSKAQFVGISNVEEVEYIKMTNIELFKISGRTTVKDKLELELYSVDTK